RSSRELHERLDDGLAAVHAALYAIHQYTPRGDRPGPDELDGEEEGDIPEAGIPGPWAFGSRIDLAPVEERLDAVQGYLGQVVEYLAARDQALVDWIQGAIRHSDDVTRAEAAQISDTLTGRLDQATGDVQARVQEAVAIHVQGIHERLQQHARALGEALAAVEARALGRLEDQDLRMDGQAEQLEAIRM